MPKPKRNPGPRVERDAEAEPSIHPLEGEAAALLDALVAAVATLDGANRMYAAMMEIGAPMLGPARPQPLRVTDELPVAPLDAVAHALPFMRALAAPLRGAADALARYSASAASTPSTSPDLRAPRDALAAATDAVREALPFPIPRTPRTREKAQRQDALGRIAAFVREAGLEHADADVLLATERGGRQVLVSAPVPPETALVWLFEPFYQRVELAIAEHELLALERMASQWQFRRWGGDERLRVSGDAFGRGVREQEYSLVERPTLAFNASVVAALPAQPFFPAIPPRQQRLALALASSFAGVFIVRDRAGSTSTLEAPLTGRQYIVHEHNPELRYASGFTALGRLIPSADDRWLRSPGMALLSPSGVSTAAADLARGIETMRDELGPALAIEALIATLVSGRLPELPRRIAPAASREGANAMMFELNEALHEAGLAKRVAKRDAPAELRAIGGRGTQVVEYAVDRDVGEWIAALSERAGNLPRVQPEDGGTPSPARTRGRRR